MRTGCPKSPIMLSKEEYEQLRSMATSRCLPHGLINRARIVLMGAEGSPNDEIADQVHLSRQMVCKWRQRYLDQGLFV